MLLGGAAAGLIAYVFPVSHMLLRPLITLLHEFGHASTAWMLGCPAIPAFDFVYGGGVTFHESFQLPLAILIGLGWFGVGWLFRDRPRALALIGVAALVWLFIVSSENRREFAIVAMGHGGELILAGAFLYMALANVGWRNPQIERPIGAFVAFFVQIHSVMFAWRLQNDASYLAWYRQPKAGILNDLEVMSLDIKIWTGVDLSIVDLAAALTTFSLLPIGIALTLYVFRARVRDAAQWILAQH